MASPKVIQLSSSSSSRSSIGSGLMGLIIVSIVTITFLSTVAYSCNEQVCASIVSKCMLTQSCKCDLSNCTCCKECFNCLNYLYDECCSCVEMCPNRNETRQLNSITDTIEAFPGLFDALTEFPDEKQQFVAFKFPIDFTEQGLVKEPSFRVIDSPDQNIDEIVKLNGGEQQKNVVTMNCTVIYMSQCVSMGKCRNQCTGVGASSMRWFQDGCCECVGHTCVNYGVNESRCLHCSENMLDEDLESLPNEDELDYGEGMEPLDGTIDHVNKL